MKLKWIWAATALLVVGCASSENTNTGASIESEPTVYTVRGIYHERSMDGDGMRVTHEEIPGYMVAMTMDFPVRDSAEVLSLVDGDKIEFTLTLTATEGYAHDIQTLDPATELTLPGQ